MTQTEHMQDESVGSIAARLAGASAVFRRYGIDFCCQGHAPLKEAANHRRLDLAEVENALAALDASESPQVPDESDALVEHIQTHYHDVHRRQLGELIELSRKVEAVHVTHREVPAGLAETLTRVREELEVHMKKEELMIFPAMRRRRPGSLSERIREMRHDHDDHARFLDQIARLTDDYTPPEGACRSWRSLYAGAAQFRDDLVEHVHLENNVLFPRFETYA